MSSAPTWRCAECIIILQLTSPPQDDNKLFPELEQEVSSSAALLHCITLLRDCAGVQGREAEEDTDSSDDEFNPNNPNGRRLCVSLCGSLGAMVRTQQDMETAVEDLGPNTDVQFELNGDYHG